PQITFRWTKETPHEIMRYMMASERSDRFKRIAFTNDEKRLKCFTEICGIPYSRAVGYTMVGCNEPAFLGSITGGNSKINILRSMETLFHRESEKILNVCNFDEFYSVYEEIMLSELEIAYEYDDKYNRARAEDINYISSLFTEGCIENAKSLTRGGGNTVIVSPMILGITNVIDSLIVVRQFVFDEKLLTMEELQRALACNWQGFEEKRDLIINSGDFFGNDTPRSNDTARRLYDSFYRYLKDKTNLFGYHFLVGDILGYNEHHQWFGEKTKATPDGRYDGDYLKFCIGQSEGRDRAGLTALLNSVATLDPTGIACGSTATNITLDEALIKDDKSFEKLVYLFEAYFHMGGVHFQLNYASKEELLAAREEPGNYRNLRVRVTGFSDFFVNLAESIQDDIIERTQQTAID
ncbi:MAG: hypothetical protein GX633_03910, partial [Clostridiales bacterium]|nr:hypothetical protein [Clostridiales bacterium]